MLCWFAGFAVLGVWNVFRSPALDYRLVVVGAVLPVGEAVLGGPRVLHSLSVAAAVLAAVMLATRRRRQVRRRLLGVPIGLFAHLVLDGVWARPRVFWWPFFGPSFGAGQVPELTRGAIGVLLELAGVAALWWSWRAFGLERPEARDRFLRTGRLEVRPAGPPAARRGRGAGARRFRG